MCSLILLTTSVGIYKLNTYIPIVRKYIYTKLDTYKIFK